MNYINEVVAMPVLRPSCLRAGGFPVSYMGFDRITPGVRL